MTTAFSFAPDYSTQVTLRYKYLTKVFSSYGYCEQRVPAVEVPKISESFTVTEEAKNLSSLILSSAYIVPIFPAVIYGTKTATNKINMSTSLTFFSNIIYLVDSTGVYGEIASISGTEITLTSAWTGQTSGYFYPAFLGRATSIDKDIVWNNLLRLSLTFEEE